MGRGKDREGELREMILPTLKTIEKEEPDERLTREFWNAVGMARRFSTVDEILAEEIERTHSKLTSDRILLDFNKGVLVYSYSFHNFRSAIHNSCLQQYSHEKFYRPCS